MKLHFRNFFHESTFLLCVTKSPISEIYTHHLIPSFYSFQRAMKDARVWKMVLSWVFIVQSEKFLSMFRMGRQIKFDEENCEWDEVLSFVRKWKSFERLWKVLFILKDKKKIESSKAFQTCLNWSKACQQLVANFFLWNFQRSKTALSF